MIHFRCKNCGKALKVDDKHAGKMCKCPSCVEVFIIPVTQSADPFDSSERVPPQPTESPRTPLEEPENSLSYGTSSPEPKPETDNDALESLRRAAGSNERSSTAQVEPTVLQKLRLRRPAFTYFRSGLGLFLLLAFFLPWVEVTCNNNTIMHPSAFNLVTGIQDSKTKGTMRMADEVSGRAHEMSRMADEMSEMADERSKLSGKRSSGRDESEFSYWKAYRKSDHEGLQRDNIEPLLARLALMIYAFLLMPILVVLCGILLWGQLRQGQRTDPPWDRKVQNAVAVLASVAVLPVIVYALLFKPSEIPPMIDMSLDWGFYLTLAALLSLSILLFLEKRKQASTQVRVVVLLLVFTIVVTWQLATRSASSTSGDRSANNAVWFGNGGSVRTPDKARFSIQRRAHQDEIAGTSSAYVITNVDESPLTISRVIYNGEHEAGLAWWWETPHPEQRKKLPVTLSIGASQYFMKYTPWQGGPFNYPKGVVFIDIFTNRGNFRYRNGVLEIKP